MGFHGNSREMPDFRGFSMPFRDGSPLFLHSALWISLLFSESRTLERERAPRAGRRGYACAFGPSPAASSRSASATTVARPFPTRQCATSRSALISQLPYSCPGETVPISNPPNFSRPGAALLGRVEPQPPMAEQPGVHEHRVVAAAGRRAGARSAIRASDRQAAARARRRAPIGRAQRGPRPAARSGCAISSSLPFASSAGSATLIGTTR